MLRGSTPNIVAENVRLLKGRGHSETDAIKKAHAHASFHAATGALTALQRDSLPDGAFALPNRRYPIHNVKHARNALARVAQHGVVDHAALVVNEDDAPVPTTDAGQALVSGLLVFAIGFILGALCAVNHLFGL